MKIENSTKNMDEVFNVPLTRAEIEFLLVHTGTLSENASFVKFHGWNGAFKVSLDSHKSNPYNKFSKLFEENTKKFEPITVTIENLDELAIITASVGRCSYNDVIVSQIQQDGLHKFTHANYSDSNKIYKQFEKTFKEIQK